MPFFPRCGGDSARHEGGGPGLPYKMHTQVVARGILVSSPVPVRPASCCCNSAIAWHIEVCRGSIAASMAFSGATAAVALVVLLPHFVVALDVGGDRVAVRPCHSASVDGDAGCLSWRVMVEANNARGWRTVPTPCVAYVRGYMTRGQYGRDLSSVMDQVAAYVDTVEADDDGLDAWILDIDDTCLSNLLYYEAKQFGAYDPSAFKTWATKGACPGIPAVLELFATLQTKGFKVFLLSGRDEETLATCTSENLESEGFLGYERLIMRSPEYRGQSSSVFKSAMRKRLVEEGYRIRGNVGDQWSDLQGDYVGDRVFKIPNPMYYVP